MRSWKLFIVSSLFLALVSCQNKDNKIDLDEYKIELSGHAKDYMSNLKSVLVKNMKEGGPLQAVNVCSDTAETMTKIFTSDKNVKVKRYSLKNRNANNIPDEYEKKVIQKFEEMVNAGNLDDKSFLLEHRTVGDQNIVTFTKPIVVSPPCLNCHGNDDQISDDVKNILKNKYPNDKATGYKIGDLRGAISVSKTL